MHGDQDSQPRPLPSNLNVRFMQRVVPVLGGGWGGFFFGFYLLEFIFLALNPVSLRAHSEDRYVVYSFLIQDVSPTTAGHAAFYNLAAWLQDTKKLYAYSILCLWCVIFHVLVSGTESDSPTPQRAALGRWRLEAYITDASVRPFALNALIALLLTCLLGGAAIGIPGLAPTGSAIWIGLLPGAPAIFRDPFFLAYRLSYLVLLYGTLLHLTIGVQMLWSLPEQGDKARNLQVSKYSVIIVSFVVLALGLMFHMVSTIIGEHGYQAIVPNLRQIALSLVVIGVVARAFNKLSKPNADLNIPMTWKGAFKQLPAYTALPVFLILLPLLSFKVAHGLSRLSNHPAHRAEQDAWAYPIVEDVDLRAYLECLDEYQKRNYENMVVARVIELDIRVRSDIAARIRKPTKRLSAWDVAKNWRASKSAQSAFLPAGTMPATRTPASPSP